MSTEKLTWTCVCVCRFIYASMIWVCTVLGSWRRMRSPCWFRPAEARKPSSLDHLKVCSDKHGMLFRAANQSSESLKLSLTVITQNCPCWIKFFPIACIQTYANIGSCLWDEHWFMFMRWTSFCFIVARMFSTHVIIVVLKQHTAAGACSSSVFAHQFANCAISTYKHHQWAFVVFIFSRITFLLMITINNT